MPAWSAWRVPAESGRDIKLDIHIIQIAMKNQPFKQCEVLRLNAKSVALVSSLLTLLHGLYFPISFLWLVLGPIAISEVPDLPSLFFPILDTIVYLFLGVGMLRGKKGFFVYSIVWAIWSASLTSIAISYGNASYALNLLSFLIIFCSTYYYVSTNKANPDVSKALGTIAGMLALAQGIIIAIVLALPYAGLTVEAELGQFNFISTFLLLLVTGAVYLVLGIGMIKGRRTFFLFAVSWTLVEAAFAVAYSLIMSAHLTIISVLITTFATYSYFARSMRSFSSS